MGVLLVMFVPRSVLQKSKSTAVTEHIDGVESPSSSSFLDELSNKNNIQEIPSRSQETETDELKNENEDEDEDVISYSKQQRWPLKGEPVCVVCGRYGEYIVDQTDKDVCSLECKANHLHSLGLKEISIETSPNKGNIGISPVDRNKGIGKTKWDSSRDVYQEHPFITSMTNEQVDYLRQEIGIDIKGSNIPRPITELEHLSLSDQLKSNLVTNGYHILTPVQMQVIPAVLNGHDMIVSSATGSGKSLSFLLPIVHQLSSFSSFSSLSYTPLVLILSPTRELCIQIEEQAKQLMKEIPNMLTALLVGGIPIAQQLHRLKSCIKVVIATPARLQDILENHASSLNLSYIKTLVLDEVDSLLQMGFHKQITSIISCLPIKRQNLMFSATIPSRTEKLANDILRNPLFISVGTPGTPCSSIRHTILWVEEEAKKKRLFSFLNDKDLFQPPAIIFVNSRKGSLLLAEAINKVCDIAAVAIHGEMAQERRSFILTGISDGRYEVVVATGILARGLNLRKVQQVFNFDMPSSIEEFIHQVGRAGRLDSPGWAITFINNENKGIFVDIVELFEPMKVTLPSELVSSRHLSLQRERRKRKNINDHDSHGGNKHQKLDYRNRETLMDLVKGKEFKRRKH